MYNIHIYTYIYTYIHIYVYICLLLYQYIYIKDHEAWKELSDIYLEQQQLEHAKKALEEVIMLQVSLASSFSLVCVALAIAVSVFFGVGVVGCLRCVSQRPSKKLWYSPTSVCVSVSSSSYRSKLRALRLLLVLLLSFLHGLILWQTYLANPTT